jgi:hypothetical protein
MAGMEPCETSIPVMIDCLGMDVSHGLMTDMNNRTGKINIFIGKTEQTTNSSSPSQVQVHQFKYHHRPQNVFQIRAHSNNQQKLHK